MSFESDNTPDFSLIVGTLGRMEPLCLFLDSLREQPDCTFEVILIDQSPHGLPDGFTDGCGFPVRVFHRPPGLSACRNFGLRHAVGRFVAFPDDDCEYPPGLLASIRAEFLREPALGGVSTLVTDRAGRFSAGGYMASAPCRMTPGNIWRTAVSPSLFFRRESLADAAFDERLGAGSGTVFGSGEETDFCLALIERGVRLEYMPQYTVWHPVYEGPWDGDRAYRYGCGFGAVLRKHGASFATAIRFAGYQFARALQRLLTGHPARAGYHYRQALGRLHGYRTFKP